MFILNLIPATGIKWNASNIPANFRKTTEIGRIELDPRTQTGRFTLSTGESAEILTNGTVNNFSSNWGIEPTYGGFLEMLKMLESEGLISTFGSFQPLG